MRKSYNRTKRNLQRESRVSILRKKGKEKLRFRRMSKRVTNLNFIYLKKLFLQCLNENRDIAESLHESYKLIQVLIFYDITEPKILNSIVNILKDKHVSCPAKPVPAFVQSRNNVGCIVIFLKHLNEFTQRRKDIEDIESYQKNGIFEELCHLVEQNGDSGKVPYNYDVLWKEYVRKNLVQFGNAIIAQLDTDRNHYEVYLMMIRAYPNEWVKRYWKYFVEETDNTYNQQYENWKLNVSEEIVFARLATDTLRTINVLYVTNRISRDKVSEENNNLFNILVKNGKFDLSVKRRLIEKDMGVGALELIDSLSESVFKSSEVFFSVILDLWKSLSLI